jgi:tetratricopeptide (TPR) repeat protein
MNYKLLQIALLMLLTTISGYPDILGKSGSQFLGTWIKVSGTYTVNSGDSLWTIAHRFNCSVAQLQALNNLSHSPAQIGQVLKLPPDAGGAGTITIEDNGDQFLVSTGSQRTGAVYKDGFLMVGDTMAITYIKSSVHITLPEGQGGGEYARQSPALPLVYKAVADINDKNWDQAIADSSAAIKLDPNLVGAYLQRGKAYLSKNDYDNAITDLTAGLKLGPEALYSYLDRAQAYCGKGDYDDAIADCTKAIQLDRKDDTFLCTFYDRRASIKETKGDLEGAIADFSTAHQLSPGELGSSSGLAAAYGKHGNANQVKGDFEGAIADYTKAIELVPNMALETRFYLSFTLRRLHRDDAPAGLATLVKEASTATGMETIWPVAEIRYLTGNLAEKDFLVTAAQGDDQTVRIQQCKAFYYAGMTHLLNNDATIAQELFSKCNDTKFTGMDEYVLARAELARLQMPAAK